MSEDGFSINHQKVQDILYLLSAETTQIENYISEVQAAVAKYGPEILGNAAGAYLGNQQQWDNLSLELNQKLAAAQRTGQEIKDNYVVTDNSIASLFN